MEVKNGCVFLMVTTIRGTQFSHFHDRRKGSFGGCTCYIIGILGQSLLYIISENVGK